jgi:hypothetical protein
MFDLPRRAEIKVAWHLLDRRADPSSKEGKTSASSTIQCGGLAKYVVCPLPGGNDALRQLRTGRFIQNCNDIGRKLECRGGNSFRNRAS